MKQHLLSLLISALTLALASCGHRAPASEGAPYDTLLLHLLSAMADPAVSLAYNSGECLALTDSMLSRAASEDPDLRFEAKAQALDLLGIAFNGGLHTDTDYAFFASTLAPQLSRVLQTWYATPAGRSPRYMANSILFYTADGYLEEILLMLQEVPHEGLCLSLMLPDEALEPVLRFDGGEPLEAHLREGASSLIADYPPAATLMMLSSSAMQLEYRTEGGSESAILPLGKPVRLQLEAFMDGGN